MVRWAELSFKLVVSGPMVFALSLEERSKGSLERNTDRARVCGGFVTIA